ncbi:MAG: Asp23/Gls24 family envelope stress response protein [Candidatus Omnitrophica bacterium]|nr:Asp23/Gls24 family envelope stress response protein [Candidatus Omnitrophota bacterium]
MHPEDSYTDLGNIKIHKDAVASITSLAATEIEGVKRTGTDFKSGFLELIGKKSLSAIKVEFDKNGEVRIEVPLIIKYGYNIPEVASKVQENIRRNIEKMTSLSIRDININVQAIERGQE